ncbi:major facilitator superfamily domain-containing protein [Xylariales sp. PMI_506]|nr:major facilitator superfamily domain-containing protein [Xylariales sp. PMI_506]
MGVEDVSARATLSPPPEEYTPSDPPDGGREAWLMVLGGWCGTFCTLGLLNCGGTFEEYYVGGPLAAYGASEVSWVISVQSWAMNFSSIVFGRVYDKYGPRPLLLVGSPLYVLGLMMVSLGSQYWHFFLAQSVLVGISGGAIFAACISTVTSWFSHRLATAFGIVLSGAGIGGVVAPITMTVMINRVSFAWAIRTVAFIYLTLLAVTCLTVKARLKPQPRPFVLAEYLNGFRELPYAFIVIASFMFFWGMFLPLNYILLQAKAQGVNPALVPYLLPIINALSVLGRIGPGIVADKVGRFNTVITITGLSAIFTLALWIPGTSEAAIIVYALLFGFSSGGFISLAPALIARVSDIRQIGSRTGATYAVQSFATLTGSPIAGALVSAMNGRYVGLQLFCGFSMLASCFALIASRFALVGFKATKI